MLRFRPGPFDGNLVIGVIFGIDDTAVFDNSKNLFGVRDAFQRIRLKNDEIGNFAFLDRAQF
jgi:hypothetical protein